MNRSTWIVAARWYCLVVLLFLGVRALTTLAVGAGFGMPGAGWRAVWQLLLCAVLAVGLVRPRAVRAAVAVVGVGYLVATALEMLHGADLLGIIPVDMRDRVVHPLLAVAAAGCLLIDAVRPALRRRTVG
jgi:hypothetical protein